MSSSRRLGARTLQGGLWSLFDGSPAQGSHFLEIALLVCSNDLSGEQKLHSVVHILWGRRFTFGVPVLRPDSGRVFVTALYVHEQNGDQNPGAKTGPLFDQNFVFFMGHCCKLEALSSWTWSNFLSSLCPPHKRVVYINMDETAVLFWYDKKAGYVLVPEHLSKSVFLETEQQATLDKRRLCCTLMAFVSDDAVVQSLLPQVVLVNKRTLTPAEVLSLKNALRANDACISMQAESAWVSVGTLCEVVKLVGTRLASVKPLAHCKLLIDAATIHVPGRVAAAAARAVLFLHFVPAQMTSTLQPLDVYVFAQLKKALRDLMEMEELRLPRGTIPNKTVIKLLFQAVEDVGQRKTWRKCFS